MENDIEQIAPTPWKSNYDENANTVDDSHGRYVCCAPCNDKGVLILNHIIARVNACKGLNPEAIPELLTVCGEIGDHFEESWIDDVDPDTAALTRRLRAALVKAKVPDA